MSNHGHLIEVSTESALQPLIQLYTIYIGLIMSSDLKGIYTNWQALLDAMMNKNWIQIFAILQGSKYITQAWSFISSVASIAWSFQANYARKKFGQMSILSRFVYFCYVLLAVISRILCIELFLLTLGPGYFLAIYVIIGGHLISTIMIGIKHLF